MHDKHSDIDISEFDLTQNLKAVTKEGLREVDRRMHQMISLLRYGQWIEGDVVIPLYQYKEVDLPQPIVVDI